MIGWLLLGTALAQVPDEVVTWDNVSDVAAEVWTSGPGARDVAAAEGAARAAGRVPLGPTSVRVEAQVGLAAQTQAMAVVELPLDLGVAGRRAWASQARARSAANEEGRWAFIAQVHEAWLRWWLATEVGEHLEAYAAEVELDLARLSVAADQGLIPRLDLEDLRAEALTVRAEAVAASHEVATAEAALRGWLGPRALDAGGHHLHDLEQVGDNPWTGLSARAEALPSVRADLAAAEAARREVAVLAVARLPVLEAGPMWAPGSDGRLAPLGFVGVRVPLQPGVAPAQQVARAEAAGAEASARWHAAFGAAALDGEALAWDAAHARLQRLQGEVVGPLEGRVVALQGALAAGLVTVDRVVRARQDHHEAEHEVLRVAGELLASEARARLASQMMEGR